MINWPDLRNRARNPRTLLRGLVFVIAAVPAIYLGHLVHRYGVEVPAWDDWEMAPLIVKAHVGGLRFSDLFAQQQEGRTLLPKLVFILSAWGRHWDVRNQMALSIIFCWLTAFGIYLLLRRSGLSFPSRVAALFLIVLFIFSPAQYELWLLASGFPSFLPALCLVAALLILQSNSRVTTKFILCAILASATSFTLPQGLLLWGLTFPVLFLWRKIAHWQWWLAGWCLVAAMCACAYFWTYRKPHDLPEFAPAVSAASYIQYVFAFLGSGLARWMAPHHLGLSAIVGVVIICLFSGAVIYTARRWRDREFLVRTLPWLTLGIYSLANAVLASLGRIAFGVDQALASRYVTYSLYLTVAVIALVSVIAQERLQPPTSVRTRRVVFVTCLILALLYLTLSWFSCGQSVSTMRLACVRSRLARGAVVFSQSLDTAAVIKEYSYPRPQFVQIQAAALDNLRLLRPGLIRNNDISALRYDDVDNRNASGWCDGIMPVGNQFYRATGWTVLNRKHFPADCVVLAYKIPARDWTAFAISDGMFEREDIVRLCGGDRDLLWSGWSATFPRDLVPTGATVSAWALDAADSKLYRLKQKFEGLPF